MAKNKLPELDLASLGLTEGNVVESLTNLFKGYVSDVTNPEFQTIVANLAADSMRIAQMKTKGARQALIDEATEAVKARAASALKVPGLIASGRQGLFLDFAGRVLNGLIGYGFVALRAAAGIPPVPAGGGGSQG